MSDWMPIESAPREPGCGLGTSAEHAVAAPNAQPLGEWVMVPREMTPEMMRAVCEDAGPYSGFAEKWAAALYAAPKAEQVTHRPMPLYAAPQREAEPQAIVSAEDVALMDELVKYYSCGVRTPEAWQRLKESFLESKVRPVIAPPSKPAATGDERFGPASAGVSEADSLDLLRRALPFLRDAAKPYEDDGANEPLEIARDIEDLLDARPQPKETQP